MAIENVEVALQINDALAKQHALLAKSTKELKDQLSILQGINSAHQGDTWDRQLDKMKEVRKALEGLEDKGADTSAQFKQTQRALEEMASRGRAGMRDLGNTIKKDLSSRFPEIIGLVTGFIGGATKGFGLLTNIVTGTVGAVTSLGEGIFSLARSIIAIPFKILGGLVDMANNLPSDTAFGEAREAIRKEFGDFGEDLAGTTKKMYKSLRGELAETNLSVFRVFGNMAERLAAMHEVVKGMGNVASLFKEELRGAVDKSSTERILAFQKGLGISGEQMKQIGTTAKVSGKRMTDVLLEITKASTGFSDAFGLSQKVIARDIATMNADIANFGSLTVHEMGRAAVYVQKLGLEIKDVIGIIEKYDNFEDAAVGAAHLAQAFGANVDALDMMREQDPSKRLDMMRKSMALAGVDAEKLTRQELKLLAQQTGLTEEAAKMAFSLKNQGISMKDLEKQQGRNQKKTMTQEEAMVRLSDSIERLVKSGSSSGGFFTQFFQGFEKGVKRMSPFRKVLRFIRRDLRIVKWLGVQTGAAFAKFFPGVKDVIQGMLEFFNPKRFKQLRSDLGGIFKDMFKDNISFETGLNKIKNVFIKFFTGGAGGAAFKKIRDGALKMGTFIMKWVGEGIKMGIGFMIKAMDFLREFILNPKAAIAKVKAAANSTKNPIVKMFMPLWAALKSQWPAFSKSFIALWEVVWPKIVSGFKKIAGPAVKLMFLSVLGPAAIQGILGMLVGSITKGVIGSISGLLNIFNGKLLTKFPSIATKLFSKMSGILRVAGPIGLAAGAALGVSEGLDLFYDKIHPKFDETTRKMAAAATGIIHGLTLGLLPEDLEIKIANAIAQISEYVFNSLEKTFGASFVKNLKEYLSPLVDFWDGLGDFISGFIAADDKKISAALEKMVEKAGVVLFNGMKFMVIELVPAFFKFVITAFSAISNGISKFIRSLIPRIGALLSALIKAVFGETAGKWTKNIFKFVAVIYDTFRRFVFETLPNFFKSVITGFTEFGNMVWNLIKDIFSPTSWGETFDNFGISFKNSFNKFKNSVLDSFSDLSTGVGGYWDSIFDDGEIKHSFETINKSFADCLTNVQNQLANDKSTPAAAVAWAKEIGDNARNAMLNIGTSLGVDLTKSLSDGMQKQASTESGVIMGSIEKLLAPITGAFNDPVSALKTMNEQLVKNLQAGDLEAAALKMGKEGVSLEDMSLYNSIKDLDQFQIEANIANFRDNIVPLFIDGENSLLGTIQKLSKIMEETGALTSIGRVSSLTAIAAQLGPLASSFDVISKISLDPRDIVRGMRTVDASLTAIMVGVNNLAINISESDMEGIQASQARITSVTQIIEGLVQEVNEINSELSDLNGKSNVKIKLQRLAKSLGVKNEKFEIKNDKVKIQVQLDIKMEAEQIAYALHKGKWFTVNHSTPAPKKS